MPVLGMFPTCGTDSHTVISSYLYSSGLACCTYVLGITKQNHKPVGFPTPRSMTLARTLQNLTMPAHSLSQLLYQILRYNPSTTQNIAFNHRTSSPYAGPALAQYQSQNNTAGCMGRNCHRALFLRRILVKSYDQRHSKPFWRNNIHLHVRQCVQYLVIL